MIGRTLLAVAALGVVAVGCPRASAPDDSDPAARTATGDEASSDKEQQTMGTCTTAADLERAFGSVCRVIGTYEVREFRTKKGTVFREWPVVKLEDGTDVLIETLWDESKKPDDATTEKYEGKRVAVTGKLHGEPPGSIQNIPTPCVSPVDSIESAPE